MEQFFAEAEQLGLDAVAVTHAEKFTECLWHLEKIKSEGHYPDFTEQDLQIRIDPKAVLPSAKTIISTAIAYKTELPKLSPQSGCSATHGVLTTTESDPQAETLAEWMQKPQR